MGRQLESGEISLAREIYKSSINYNKVVIHDAKYFPKQAENSGMTPSGEIYMNGVYQADYSKDFGANENVRLKPLFIHEMAHVWQYQNDILPLGVIGSAIYDYITYKLDYSQAYLYTLTNDKDLVDYDIEQQAAIIEDYFRVYKRGWGFREGHIQNTETFAENKKMLQHVMASFIANPSSVK